jgi:hypothetical protein
MHDWLEQARVKVASAVDEDPAGYDLSPADVEELLELARLAAHESGERTNAPLVCYLVGLAHGRRGGELADLVDAVIGKRV